MKQYVINLNTYNVLLRGKRVFALECVSDRSLKGRLLQLLGSPRMEVTYLDGTQLKRERVSNALVTPIAPLPA